MRFWLNKELQFFNFLWRYELFTFLNTSIKTYPWPLEETKPPSFIVSTLNKLIHPTTDPPTSTQTISKNIKPSRNQPLEPLWAEVNTKKYSKKNHLTIIPIKMIELLYLSSKIQIYVKKSSNSKSINFTSLMIKNWNNSLPNFRHSKSSLKNANNIFSILNNKINFSERSIPNSKLKCQKFRRLKFMKRNTEKKRLKI